MDLKTIRALTKMMQEYDLVDLEIESNDLKVKLSKAKEIQTIAAPAAVSAPAPAAAAPAPAVAAAPSAEDEALAKCAEITSPIPGTFYSKPNPDADVFCSVGDSVKEGQVLCLVEAMKVFNEIKSDKAGVIKKICVDDGQAVEYGTPLFLVG